MAIHFQVHVAGLLTTSNGSLQASQSGGGGSGLRSVPGPADRRADEVFVAWLKEQRQRADDMAAVSGGGAGTSEKAAAATGTAAGVPPRIITLQSVKDKVTQIMEDFGVEAIEHSCKWFLMWNNRYYLNGSNQRVQSMFLAVILRIMGRFSLFLGS